MAFGPMPLYPCLPRLVQIQCVAHRSHHNSKCTQKQILLSAAGGANILTPPMPDDLPLTATPDLDAAHAAVVKLIHTRMPWLTPDQALDIAEWGLLQRAEEADRAASMYPHCKCHAGFTNRGLIDPDCRHCDDSKEFTERAKFLRSQVRS